MTASLKASTDGTQAIIQVNGVDKVFIDSRGIVTGVAGAGLIQGTVQSTTAGTLIDFTGIPSWVKRITVMFNGVSTNGTSALSMQLGAGSVQTTGYVSNSLAGSASTAYTSSTSGFVIFSNAAASVFYGLATFVNVSGNIWVGSHSVSTTAGQNSAMSGSGGVTLSGTLDRFRLTTGNGTDTFDAGTINILYE